MDNNMLNPGQFNLLRVSVTRHDGVILDAGEHRELFLPAQPGARSYQVGEEVRVFIYLDSSGRWAATTEQPLAEMGQVAWLEVVDVNEMGAFADWGLPKNLFIPFAEQQYALRKGQHTLVKVYLDKLNRIAGSTRIDHWIEDDASGLNPGDKVSLIIADRTELGFKAVINHRSWGLLYANELYRRISKGMILDGYIKTVRADNKVDLSLSKPGFDRDKLDSVGEKILAELEARDGFLHLTDKSPPAEIYATFGVSKKVFKQALGALYKQRIVQLEAGGVSLLGKAPTD